MRNLLIFPLALFEGALGLVNLLLLMIGAFLAIFIVLLIAVPVFLGVLIFMAAL